jgi:hypothetical protein
MPDGRIEEEAADGEERRLRGFFRGMARHYSRMSMITSMRDEWEKLRVVG